MRILVIILLSIFSLSLRGYAQPSNPYTVSTISAMKTYYGAANRIHVTATGEDYQICSPCTADEVNIYLGTGERRWKKVVPDTYLQNGAGDGDTLMRNQADTFYYRRIKIAVGVGIAVDTVQTPDQITYTFRSTGAIGLAKAVPDADYAITASDHFIVLPDPTTTRTLTLPAASTMPRQIKKIYNRANVTGEWVLNGSYILYGTGALTEDVVNGDIITEVRLTLESTEVSTGVWKWIQSN